MSNEYYGVASTPTDDFIAHYGIRGMKWGVRKAIERGDERALSRQFKKAQKKLAKLEKLGSSGKKYAKRAAGYGVGAAAVGGLAVAGTHGANKIMNRGAGLAGRATGVAGKVTSGVGKGLTAAGYHLPIGGRAKAALKNAGLSTQGAGLNMQLAAKNGSAASAVRNAGKAVGQWGNQTAVTMGGKKLSNNMLVRAGAGAVGAGLGIASARNAYRAATAKKHAAQAKEFRAEMNKAFAGTKYANSGSSAPKKKRRSSKA